MDGPGDRHAARDTEGRGTEMNKIAVLTSGGDAPGMNAAIRAVVRTGIGAGLDVYGVHNGYEGLINGELRYLSRRDVGGILHTGGTFLGSARCAEFRTVEGRQQAMHAMQRVGVEALVVIGGNGSQSGSQALYAMGFPVVGVASTIDNDLEGTDITIGVDSAINVALEAIDRLRTTAASHGRVSLVETMGRKCGYVALMAGIAGGAEVVVIPEEERPPEEIGRTLRAAFERGKSHALAVVAEGAKHNARALETYFQEHPEAVGAEVRATILGHVQRGASPTARDRLLATRLGEGAVRALLRGEQGVLVGMRANHVATTPLEEVAGRTKSIDLELFELAHIMAR